LFLIPFSFICIISLQMVKISEKLVLMVVCVWRATMA